jgi:hypothetical protein
MSASAICQHCNQPFTRRSHRARFCSDAHKVAWHRARNAIGVPLTAPQMPRRGPVTIEPTADTPEAKTGSAVTIETPIPKPARKLPKGIVPDSKWPGMYRIRLPDGSLSDMVNLTRAKDALAAIRDGGAA